MPGSWGTKWSVKGGEQFWGVKKIRSSEGVSVVAASFNFSHTKPLKDFRQIFKISFLET